jgi:hypothetical protein
MTLTLFSPAAEKEIAGRKERRKQNDEKTANARQKPLDLITGHLLVRGGWYWERSIVR